MKLLVTSLIVGFILFSQASADAPECDQEEVEQFWDDAIPRVFDSIEAHIRDYDRIGLKYEGYPDLACFTKLYLSYSDPSEAEIHRRVIRLLDLDVEKVYRDLAANSGDPGTFIFEEFFEEVLCVAQKLGRLRADRSACEKEMLQAVVSIESIRHEAEKDKRAKEEAERKQKEEEEEERLAEEERKNEEKRRLAEEKRKKAEQEKRKEEEQQQAEAERKRKEKEEEEKKRRQELVKYQPLFRRGTAADETYCRRAFNDESRWPRDKYQRADPNKQVDLDHCWDLTSIGGGYFYGEALSRKKAESLKGQYNGWIGLGTSTKRGMYILGRAKRVGRGTRPDLQKSIEFYRRSARSGFAKAQYFMGMFYAEGHGVSQDFGEAEIWLRKSVKQNDADAKAYLGYLLEFGIGLDRNLVESKKLYREAAKKGHRFARERLSKLR